MPRHRYVAFRVDADRPLSFGDVVHAIRQRDDDAWLVDFDGQRGIVRCPHTAKERTIDLLAGIDAIDDDPVRIEPLGTSGTVRKCREKFLA